MAYHKILIVDDSGTSRMIIRRCFEIAGFDGARFFEAEDGIDALTILEANDMDLIVTDLNMPKMDGYTLIQKLRIRQNTRRTPVIVISSMGKEASPDDWAAMDLMGVIKKPISPAKISELLEVN